MGQKREIKFRAWDEQEKGMIAVTSLDLSGGQDEFISCYGYFIDDKEQVRTIFHFLNPPIMQFTGLKDKNGKEIYEGDILGDTSCPDDQYILGKVAYCETPDCIYAGQFMLQDKDGYSTDWDGVEPEHWHIYEVIGNIYENPELLKQEE